MGEYDLIEGSTKDKLLARIEKDKQARMEKGRLETIKQKLEKVRLETVYSICSVYRLLLLELGMDPGSLSLEEFEAAEAEFKKLAEQKTRSWAISFQSRRQRKWWKYYLERGYFPEEYKARKKDNPWFLIRIPSAVTFTVPT